LNSPRLIESPRCGAPLTGRRRTGRTCDNERKGEGRREKREARREKREREEVSEETEKKGGGRAMNEERYKRALRDVTYM
jgi:hypothetical protein